MFGDIFICQFPFTSGAASKIRPALVLFDLEQLESDRWNRQMRQGA